MTSIDLPGPIDPIMQAYLETEIDDEIYFCRLESIEINGELFVQVEEGGQFERGTKYRKKLKGDGVEVVFKNILREKLAQGYVEVAEPVAEIPHDWQRLIEATNLSQAVAQHFRYLVSIDDLLPYYDALMASVEKVSVEYNRLVVKFHTATLKATKPKNIRKYQHWPESFQSLIQQHGHIEFPQDNWALHLGVVQPTYHQGLTWQDLIKNAHCKPPSMFKKPNSALCPFVDYASYYLYHPTIKNSYAEAALFQIDPEGGKTYAPVDWKAGDVYVLRAVAVADVMETSGLKVRSIK